jgi:hypothetical protein
MTPTTPSEQHDVTMYSGPTSLLALDTNVFTLETGSLTKGYVIPNYCANNGNITSIESVQGDIVCAVTGISRFHFNIRIWKSPTLTKLRATRFGKF